MSVRDDVGLALLISVALGATALLTYEVVLLHRFATGGAHNVGGDVIQFAYILVAASIAGAAISIFMKAGNRRMRHAAAFLALLASLVWFALHLGGSVYSHESMFIDKAGS